MTNLLNDAEGNLTFNQYVLSDFWTGGTDESGYPILSATVDTIEDVPYELEFSLAANLAADVQTVQVEITFNGETVGSFVHEGGLFSTYDFSFDGTGESGVLQFRVMGASSSDVGGIDTSGVVPSYEKTVTFLGQEITLNAFAPGQNLVYQVLGGQLNVFDLETETYSETEYKNNININAMGYSTAQDLIFGHARGSGTDAVGNAVASGDIIAYDATGAVYKVASTSYSHYIGDMDDQGYLWTFSGGLSTAVRYDLSTIGADGSIAHTAYALDNSGLPTGGTADLAYNATTQKFYGISRSDVDGFPGAVVEVDISQFLLGGEISVGYEPLSGTIVDGTIFADIPGGAYGATMTDADGNIYAGANNTNHDFDSSTAKTGGFYKVVEQNGNSYLELISEAPQSSNNDGAMDIRGVDPFLGVDNTSTVLLREPVLSIAIAEDDSTHLASKGTTATVDLLANDSVTEGETLTLTHLNGTAVSTGMTLTLANGEVVTYLGNGVVTVTPPSGISNVESSLEYSIVNTRGITDTGTLNITVSPVQGTANNDSMMNGYTDGEGDQINGADGDDDVILGYGGNDKIYSGDGNDDIWGGTGNDFMRGNNGNDLINGEDGNDVLDGGAGVDTMIGGDGNDVYYIDDVNDVVTEAANEGRDKVKSKINYTLLDNFEDLWLERKSAATIAIGNDVNNRIYANLQDCFMQGLGGDDAIIGSVGNDSAEGGLGNDNIKGAGGNDTLHGDEGRDKLDGGDDDDNLYGGADNDSLSGGAGDDTLDGGDGNDLLAGHAGTNVLIGGLGNDSYKVSSVDDVVIEDVNGGRDIVRASVDWTLHDNVESLALSGTAISGTGNDLNNRVTGNSEDNILSGGLGNDTMSGKHGDDTIFGGEGNDRLDAHQGDDSLSGGAGSDRLSGSTGNDTLDGGTGNDFLGGGDDADVFVFTAGDGSDVIFDFDLAEDSVLLTGESLGSVTWVEANSGAAILNYGVDDAVLFSRIDFTETDSISLLFA